MITYDINQTVTDNGKGRYELNFKGLSSDAKPTGRYKNMVISNGSTFLEMDTMGVFMYDEESRTWV